MFGTILVSTAASLFLAFLLTQFFSERPGVCSSDSPASHFKLKELVSRKSLTVFSIMCAAPFAMLFFVLSLSSASLIAAAKDVISEKLGQLLHLKSTALMKGLIDGLPSWLDPLYVLAITLLLFAPYVRAPFILFRNLVFKAISFDERVDELAERAAGAILKTSKYQSARTTLMNAGGSRDAPLARQLTNASDVKRLAYQLLHYSQYETMKRGLRCGLDATLDRIGITLPQVPRQPSPRYELVLAAFTFYAILCGAYAFLAPQIAPYLKDSHLIKVMLNQVEWPEKTPELVLTAVQRTLSFVVPLACGMLVFRARRSRYESVFQGFIVIFSAQFLFALPVNIVFDLAKAAGTIKGSELLEHVTEFTTWSDAFLYSFTPGVALLSWIVCGQVGIGRVGTIGIVCFAAAVAFCVCQLLFETMTSRITGYYWHQLVYGAFLTVSYGLAALVANEVLPTIDNRALERPDDRDRLVPASEAAVPQ